MSAADPQRRRRVWAWALYDWANSAYATTVVAVFFPAFFERFWHLGADGEALATGETIALRLGLANSLASLVVALGSPFLGAVADRCGRRQRFLVVFAALGIVMTGAMAFVGRGQWPVAAALFVLSGIGFFGGNIFYDALLVSVAPAADRDRVSALGFAVGYLGGGLMLALNVAMTARPTLFGLADATQATRAAFALVAVWWLLFALPLVLFVPEPVVENRLPVTAAVGAGWRQLVQTVRDLRGHRQVCLFLLAYWFYIDGVDTVIRMSVMYGRSLGFEQMHLVLALLVTQFVGFPAAIVFGWLGQRWGARRAILLAIGVYSGVCIWGSFMRSPLEFYVLAVTVGLVQGGVQSLSRSLYSRLIPADKAGEFFGFYNMLGKSAAIVGPPLMGLVGWLAGSSRWGIASIVLLFAAGGLLLSRVDPRAGENADDS